MERARRIDTVVVGAGQAGLCMSYVLQQEGREHVLIEKGRALEQWRSARWDSFKINSPIAYSRLMGQTDGLADTTASIPLNEMIRLWDECIAQRRFPIREQSKVLAVERTAQGRFSIRVESDLGPRRYDALNVVAAPGNYQIAKIPSFAKYLDAEVQQLRIGTYTNPSAIQEGAVLVVGGGQTGVQLAEELAAAGRCVYLATSKVKGTPRHYRGEDIMFWLDRIGLLTTPKETLSCAAERYDRMPIVGPDHPISHHSLARLGVTLLGGLRDISQDGTTATFRDDLQANIAFARQGYEELIDVIEDWISRADPTVRARYPTPTAEPAWPAHPPLLASAPPASLNLRKHRIRAVVWATGWRADLSWLQIDEVRKALDPHGLPEACETPADGFYWLGFHWLRTSTSGNGAGFHLDAPHVAARLRRGAGRNS